MRGLALNAHKEVMTNTLLIESKISHAALVEAARRWLSKCHAIVITEVVASGSEKPDAMGWTCWNTTLVECKASRSDFLADKKKMFRRFPEEGMGDSRYYLAPAGLIAVEELPEGWGLIEVSGKTTTVKHEPRARYEGPKFIGNKRAEMSLLVSAVRRLKIDAAGSMSVKTYIHETQKRGAISIEIENEHV